MLGQVGDTPSPDPPAQNGDPVKLLAFASLIHTMSAS